MNEYPMLHVLVRYGRPSAAVIAGAVAAAGIWSIVDGQVLWGALGLGAAALGYGLLLSYVELVKLVMDMLLPK
jgi:hypothetical protein